MKRADALKRKAEAAVYDMIEMLVEDEPDLKPEDARVFFQEMVVRASATAFATIVRNEGVVPAGKWLTETLHDASVTIQETLEKAKQPKVEIVMVVKITDKKEGR